MKALYSLFLLFFISYSFQNNAQNFPYLNASTGCEGQYVVDKDTNVFMYHGNQLEKFDKNFNPIWVKTYSISSFNNLLLSKTGSLYFTDATQGVLGKLDKNGNCEWAKTLGITPNQISLDRNNHLIISGIDNNSGCFIKSDTLGSVIKCRFFTNITTGLLQLNKFIVVCDSAGIYTFAWDAMCFEWGDAGVLKYDDNAEAAKSFGGLINLSEPAFVNNSLYTISQFEPGVFYSVINWTPKSGSATNHFFVITKYSNNLIQWSNQFNYQANSNITINSFIEDVNRKILFTTSLDDDLISYSNGGCVIDSAGFASESFGLFHYSWWPPVQKTIKGKLHSLYGSTYFFDVYGDDFPQNPLTVSVLDSLRSDCATHGASSMTRNGPSYMSYYDNAQMDSIINILGDITITSSLVNDSIIHDYCLVTSNLEKISKNVFTVSPNPVITELTINHHKNREILEATIFDNNGRSILSSSTPVINVSKLSPGLYFIKIKTNQGEFNQKFIKE